MGYIFQKLTFFALLVSLCFTFIATAQDANIRLEKLSSFYEYYNDSTKEISGIELIIGAEGTDYENFISRDFEISLYIIPCNKRGKIKSKTPVIIKVLTLTGGSLHQTGRFTFSNLSADLNAVTGLSKGRYRFGVWVNSNSAIPNPPDLQRDNAGLLMVSGGSDKSSIIYYSNQPSKKGKSIN